MQTIVADGQVRVQAELETANREADVKRLVEIGRDAQPGLNETDKYPDWP